MAHPYFLAEAQPHPQDSVPPPEPQAAAKQPGGQPSQNEATVESYRPQIGFSNLPPRFHVWTVKRGMSSRYLQMGPTHEGPVAYSAKLGGRSQTKVKAGAYQRYVPAVGEARSKTFSSKSIISIQGYQTTLKESGGFNSYARWPIQMPVRGGGGRSTAWEWRRRKTKYSSTFQKIFVRAGFGDWDLCQAGSPPEAPAAATFTGGAGEGSSASRKDGAELGIFQFHGAAAAGGMGDEFMAVAIVSMARMLDLYIGEGASSAGAGGASGGGVAGGGGGGC